MTISLRFFLPDGFQTKSIYGLDAETLIQAIGEKKRPSDITFTGPMGNKLPGTMYELSEDLTVKLVDGSQSISIHAGELMLFTTLDKLTH